ncbi:hypothetical protein HT136_06485 [Novosphingobium profundi]|uniref:hypothetical protein n=1 Tax=Novosphingobium profundi TaxID=1774954 RepID=UPI001BDAC710|nr:hypothetical protein [Novosphingobium profundi]MBT0668012.1 hypothetical protein [Novosphingobium profundi]
MKWPLVSACALGVGSIASGGPLAAQEASPPVAAQDGVLGGDVQASVEGDPVVRGAESSFAFPLDDLYARKHDSEAREMLDGLTVTPGFYMPFSSRSVGQGANGVATSTSPVARLDLRYQPVGYWFAQIALNRYLDSSRRQDWDPDFTYSFGYDDWHPYTFSLVYSNYTNNRFDPAPGEPVTRLDYGTVAFGYKAPLPRALAEPLLLDDTLSIDCRANLNVTPRYDRNDGGVGHWKNNVSLGCRYPFTRRLYIDFTAYAWGHGQQPWDPDFTYGFGLFDYRSNHVSLQYANYSGNRFPWRTAREGTGRFRNGGLLLSWSHAF